MKNIFITKAVAFVLVSNICLAQGPFNVGTIHPGDSIVVFYDVTINNPLAPANAASINNQGTLSGSNFSNVPTDETDSAKWETNASSGGINTIPVSSIAGAGSGDNREAPFSRWSNNGAWPKPGMRIGSRLTGGAKPRTK